MNIDINFTEIRPHTDLDFFHIPVCRKEVYADMYRRKGYTAEIAGLNRLVITSPLGYVTEYAVSVDVTDADVDKMFERDDKASGRFWRLVDKVAVARLNNLVRYINRATW